MQGGEPLSVRSSAKRVKTSSGSLSDSVKCHLPIEYAADLTPVVAGRKLERVGMLAGWRMRLIFRVGRNTASGRQDGHPGKIAGHDEGQARRLDQLVLGETARNQ